MKSFPDRKFLKVRVVGILIRPPNKGVKISNDIPDDIKSSSVRRFNQKLKLHFLEKY